ncbi:MAG: TrlF family AAA-like ATPase [Patescibacteria group bacterium]
MTLSKGLKFEIFDLHVHTPASKEDYKDKGASPDDIVDAAIAKGLRGIAITDHQTAEWVDRIKEAGEKKGLVVFPGVEILATGGEKGVHVVVIFDVNKTSHDVDQFLNKLGIFEKKGKRDKSVELTVGQIADELEKYDPSAILILAHCHSSKGVSGDIKGDTRTLIFKPRRKCILGAEANESDFLDVKKKLSHRRVVDFLDGSDPNYHHRKLGVYQSSDAHSISEIGNHFTYFKVDEPIFIEDIRQSLLDRDTRIRQSFEFQELTYSHIKKMIITSGFLEDQEFDFHEGLNSILGAKGSGKSLAIEFLRFALNQLPNNGELRNDHNAKLAKGLKPYGIVKITLTDETGKNYLVQRTYNPAENNPIEIIDLTDNTRKDIQIEEIFPVLFLSQNEIIKISEDKTGASQREFIDKFFDFFRYQREISRLNRDLNEIDKSFAASLRSNLITVALKKKIDTLNEEVDKQGRQIKNKVFVQYSKKEKIGQAIKSHIDFLSTLNESLVDIETDYKDLTPPIFDEEEVKTDSAVKRSFDVSQDTITNIGVKIKSIISHVDKSKEKVEQEYKDWLASFESIKDEYNKLVKAAGGTQVTLDQKRKELIKETSKLEKEMTHHRGKAQQIKNIAEKRSAIITKVDEAHKAYFKERQDRCKYFTKQSGGSISVSINERMDTTSFKNNLLKLKRGSWLKDDEVDVISSSISPRDFIDNIMRYEWTAKENKTALIKISDITSIKIENIEKLTHHLLDEYEYEKILALLYTSVPEDVPLISYKVDKKFKDLNELSVGQKAITLLIIALSDGSFPIVIDQPEDSLDLRTIWEDVCNKLRESKDTRQFIFTTHNSSVAVASDTDKFTILQATANKARVLFSGSINRPEIKKEVIDYLEGGEGTYNKKRNKYNL